MIDLTKISTKRGIYKFINTINNKVYYGETNDNLKNRILNHKTNKNEDYFHNAIRTYGWDSFEVEILHEFDEISKEELLWIEANYIECFETYKRENGYNILRYGNNTFGYKPSEKTKKIWSEQRKGNKNPMFGKRLSIETRRLMSESQKQLYKNGYINPNKNKKMSKEHNRKTSENHADTSGKNNGMFDFNIYVFKNLLTNEVFTGTRYDFYTKYSLDKPKVSELINKNRKSHKKWVLIK